MKALKVALVVPSFSAGGIGPVCRYAAHSLAQLTDWKVDYIALHDPQDIMRCQDLPNFRHIGLGVRPYDSAGLISWLDQEAYDVLLSSNIPPASYPHIPENTRHIMHVHDILRPVRRTAWENAQWLDGICCVSAHITDRLSGELNSVGYRGLLHTVHNGADYPSLIPRKYPSSSGLRLLYTGSSNPMKGYTDLPYILHSLKQNGVPAHLTIVGTIPEGLPKRFAELSLTEQVTWTGRISHKSCFEVAANNDVFILPSRREAFGMVTIEAMSMGCVPIAYDVPSGSQEIIENGHSGVLVPIYPRNKIVLELVALNQNRGRLETLSRNAISRARTKFSSENMGKEMSAFIGSVYKSQKYRQHSKPISQLEMNIDDRAASRRGYQRLPVRWRQKIKEIVAAHPIIFCKFLNQ